MNVAVVKSHLYTDRDGNGVRANANAIVRCSIARSKYERMAPTYSTVSIMKSLIVGVEVDGPFLDSLP